MYIAVWANGLRVFASARWEWQGSPPPAPPTAAARHWQAETGRHRRPWMRQPRGAASPSSFAGSREGYEGQYADDDRSFGRRAYQYDFEEEDDAGGLGGEAGACTSCDGLRLALDYATGREGVRRQCFFCSLERALYLIICFVLCPCMRVPAERLPFADFPVHDRAHAAAGARAAGAPSRVREVAADAAARARPPAARNRRAQVRTTCQTPPGFWPSHPGHDHDRDHALCFGFDSTGRRGGGWLAAPCSCTW
eukprot:SAG22_NODE_731_length_7588_cov_6.237281_7_plen_252_part_00